MLFEVLGVFCSLERASLHLCIASNLSLVPPILGLGGGMNLHALGVELLGLRLSIELSLELVVEPGAGVDVVLSDADILEGTSFT